MRKNILKMNGGDQRVFWFLSFVSLSIFSLLLTEFNSWSFELIGSLVVRSVFPLMMCMVLLGVVGVAREWGRNLLVYGVFFLISITSMLGYTKTLTGSHAGGEGYIFYGLSFYTAGVAYYGKIEDRGRELYWRLANPWLLFTGPIPFLFTNVGLMSFRRRLNYFLPFIVLGLFLHQVVASPMVGLFHLKERVDAVTALMFALVFEIFVYANFAGLSLLVFGVLGVLGVRAPLNFKQPFSATNLIDFWRGWHTSLSKVLKKLFYEPVRTKFGLHMAVLMVYLASAMWHGMTFNFILWGLFHGLAFICTLWLSRRKYKIIMFFVFIFSVVFGRLLFLDSDASRLMKKLHFDYIGWDGLFEIFSVSVISRNAVIVGVLFVLLESVFQNKKYFRGRNYKFYRLPVVQAVMMLILVLTVKSGVGADYAVYGQR